MKRKDHSTQQSVIHFGIFQALQHAYLNAVTIGKLASRANNNDTLYKVTEAFTAYDRIKYVYDNLVAFGILDPKKRSDFEKEFDDKTISDIMKMEGIK